MEMTLKDMEGRFYGAGLKTVVRREIEESRFRPVKYTSQFNFIFNTFFLFPC